jgi:hypothetical protein
MIILYQQENGNIAIIHPSADCSLEDLKKEIPPGAKFRVSTANLLPDSKDLSDFADALRVNFDKESDYFYFDINTARELTKNRLRRERAGFFEKNDILLRDAIIENDSKKLSEAIAERDRLRNITNLTDQATTIEQLKQIKV